MFFKFAYDSNHATSIITDCMNDCMNDLIIFHGISLAHESFESLTVTYALTDDFDEWDLEETFDAIKKLPKCTLIIAGADSLNLNLSKPKYKAFVEMQGALDYFADFVKYVEAEKTQIYLFGNATIHFKCEPIGTR